MAGLFQRTFSNDPIALTAGFASTLGRIGNCSRVAAYGHLATPAAGNDVWEGGGTYPLLAAASKLEILSASANDMAAGTGGRTATITGLDANFNPISETITLNGVTPVTTQNTYLRVNSLMLATAGTGGTNAGNITLRVQGAGAVQSVMLAGRSYAKSAIYTVPTGFTLLVTDLYFNVGGNGNAVNVVYSFTRITPAGLLVTTNEYNSNPSAPIQRLPHMGGPVMAQTTLTTRITAVGGAATDAYSAFEGYLIDNTQLS